MAATITQSKYKEVKADGTVILYHFQTNADIVVDGTTKRVPRLTDITNWDNIRTEVINARGLALNLDTRLDGFDNSLKAENLLTAIKTVDGPESELNSDQVDGCDVNDAAASATNILWSSNKIQAELNKKVDDTEVATTATANKLLKLNGVGLLPTGVTGNSATATKLATGRKIILSGDTTGEVLFDGTGDVTIETTIKDNSHAHSGVSYNGATTAENLGTTGNIMDFKLGGLLKTSIDTNGNFTGKAATATKLAIGRKITLQGDVTGELTFDGSADVTVDVEVGDASSVGGKTVDDTKNTNGYLWTAAKIVEGLGTKLDANLIETLASASGKLIIKDMLIQWGTVDMAAKTTATVTFPVPYGIAPFLVMHSDESSDFTWLTKKKPASTTNLKVEFITNKAIAGAKISWLSIGQKA
jgi:hypothetical protein